jgi:hypothetical protein
MSISPRWIAAGAAAVMTLSWLGPAQALTMKECSAKYKAAKADGTLKGMKWSEYRKAECATDAAAAPAAPATSARAAVPDATTGRAPPPAAAGSDSAVFPSAVSPKYSSESPGKARMHTCLDQYQANKAGNANGGLKWIQRGGGYYSECNKKLSQR